VAQQLRAIEVARGTLGDRKNQSANAEFDLELTAGGSALIERFRTIEDGKPVEMITLYYLTATS